MHYAYFDGKRVSRHAIKDCRASLKCKKRYDINKPKQGGKGTIETQAAHLQQINKQQMELHEDKVNQVKNDRGYIPSKGHITAMIQPVPKSNKEQKSIS
jgi:hypothetical protein